MSRKQRGLGLGTLAAALVGLLALGGATSAGLVNRWSFSESGGAGTILVDSVGGQNGVIVNVGGNDATVGGGQVTLAGGGKGSSDYVDLPNGLISSYTDATIETWATPHSVQNWSRVFDFGQATTNNLIMTWTRGTNINQDRVGFTVGGVEHRVDDTMAPYTLGQPVHVALAIDDDGGSGSNTLLTLYKDGARRGSLETSYNLSQLVDVNNWLGRSEYPDNTANASYDEFRIYDQALKQNQIVHHNTLGPNNTGLLPPGFYPLADWRFNTDDDGNPVSDGQAIPNGGGANTANVFDETRNFAPRHQGETRDTPHYRAYDPNELAGRVGVADGFALGTGGGGVGEGYVFFRDDSDLATNGDFSVWGRVKRLSNIGGSADEFVFSQPYNWDFSVNSGGTLDVDIGGLYGDTGVPINVGQWYDLGLVLDENGATDTVKIFVDGGLVSTFIGAVSFAGSDWFHIGAGPGGSHDFHALFDRVVFWDEAVDGATINLMTTPEPGSVVLLAGGLLALARRRRRR